MGTSLETFLLVRPEIVLVAGAIVAFLGGAFHEQAGRDRHLDGGVAQAPLRLGGAGLPPLAQLAVLAVADLGEAALEDEVEELGETFPEHGKTPETLVQIGVEEGVFVLHGGGFVVFEGLHPEVDVEGAEQHGPARRGRDAIPGGAAGGQAITGGGAILIAAIHGRSLFLGECGDGPGG